jgi:hypothetical protein
VVGGETVYAAVHNDMVIMRAGSPTIRGLPPPYRESKSTVLDEQCTLYPTLRPLYTSLLSTVRAHLPLGPVTETPCGSVVYQVGETPESNCTGEDCS